METLEVAGKVAQVLAPPPVDTGTPFTFRTPPTPAVNIATFASPEVFRFTADTLFNELVSILTV